LDAIDALHQRTASPRLIEPAPSNSELETIYKAGLRAPDHGMLRPWRFLVVKAGAREKLGELFAENINPDSEEQKIKLRNAPMRAPIVIVSVAEIQEHPKVPPVEQITATAAAIQNMSVAIHALGYASIWRTGKAAFNDGVKEALGFSSKDEIVGFLYVGTPAVQREIPENKTKDFFKEWAG
jgi:nitroreductase